MAKLEAALFTFIIMLLATVGAQAWQVVSPVPASIANAKE